MPQPTSRQRFRDYLTEIADRRRPGTTAKENEKSSSERNRSFWQLLREFWRLLKGHRSNVIFALGTLTIATLLGLIPPAGTKFAIDYVLSEPRLPMPDWLDSAFPDLTRMGLLWLISGVVITITLIRTTVHLWGRWYATKAVNRVQADIRRQVFEHSLNLPLHRVQELKSGGATSLIREDAGGVADLIFNMLYNPWRAIIQLLGSLAVLVLVDWRLMLGGLMLLPAVWVTHRTWIQRVRPLYKDIRKQRQQVDSATTETFGGIRVVRTFARNQSEENRFTRNTNLLVRKQLMVWWATRGIEIIWDVLIPLASTGLLLYGGWQILQAQLTLGDLMMFLVYLTMLLGPIASIASSSMAFQNNLAGLERVLDLLQEKTESESDPHAQPINRSEVEGELILQDVSFRYPGTQKFVLEDISVRIPAGATVALVGRSGAGKTTLCNLVARFYEPTAGTIQLDDQDLCDIELHSYRKLLGVVEQDVFLFDGTIRQNIEYARTGATEQQIVAAAEAAAARDFIERLPQGFDTWIGERGVKLSGGQRQRLAIARAILADPRILILDEATSNLDSESERFIQNSLKQLLQGRTAIVIAHRLSTITHADLILVLDQGRIVEQGTHQQLINRGGLYRKMVVLQTEGAKATAEASSDS